jgi:hypothetical protein
MLAELCNRYHNYRTFLSPQRETTRGHSSLQPPAPPTHFLCQWTCLLWTFRTMESCNLWPFVSGFSCRGSHCKVVHAAAASELFLHSGTRCSVPRCFLTCPWRDVWVVVTSADLHGAKTTCFHPVRAVCVSSTHRDTGPQTVVSYRPGLSNWATLATQLACLSENIPVATSCLTMT